uniref:Uncharacterized protein n=1 Tax=Phage sp. ct4bw6 TaxID=2826747 RepID=A0A8S5MVN3_9VIRU|nr:MAG TPA: hypothetical protein [Phage sp. ct4bw6]
MSDGNRPFEPGSVCGKPAGDVRGKLRTRSAWTSSQRLMSLRRKDLPAAGRGNAGRQRPTNV